ncbi:DUF721 domain-containing protein [Sphingomonas sp.]|uniref:DUF721 domain-containing protein n=1 Tax=Sphingomonas sp. TaxID=28214 RepID=UPI002DB98EBA|nr:DciA family protein [Sphingomonas sp.]HEU4967505.1 DciA family protein [Sphingomonas sp.]
MTRAMSGRKAKQDETPRGGRARSVAELLPDAGRASFRKFGFVQHAIVSRWAEIVGSRYAGVSAPESIRFPQGKRSNGTLTLTVSGAHAPMMQHVLPEIVERVNRFFGYPAVARVAIRQGVVTKAAAKPARPELQPVPVELGDSLRAVGDPELRAVLESLARGIATTESIPIVGRVKA